MNILKGSVNNLGTKFKAIDSLSGLPKSDLTSASGELQLWYYRQDKGKVSVTLTDITNDSEYTAGGICHISDGIYRVDLPNEAFEDGSDYVIYGGSALNGIVLGDTVQLTESENVFTPEVLNSIANKVISKLGVNITISPTDASVNNKFDMVLYPENINSELLLNSAFLHLQSGTTSRIVAVDGLTVTVSPGLLTVPQDGDVIVVFGKYLENL